MDSETSSFWQGGYISDTPPRHLTRELFLSQIGNRKDTSRFVQKNVRDMMQVMADRLFPLEEE